MHQREGAEHPGRRHLLTWLVWLAPGTGRAPLVPPTNPLPTGTEAAIAAVRWEAAGREDARAGKAFRGPQADWPIGRESKAVEDAYSRGFWSEFDRLRFERGEYDLL